MNWVTKLYIYWDIHFENIRCVKVSVFGVILVRIFPEYSPIRTEYGEILVRMTENAGKMQIRITSNGDTLRSDT